MHGSGRSQGWLIHLLAGAALGAVVVLVVWIFSGGRPFGDVVGTSDVSAPTPAAVQPAGTDTPADEGPQLASEPPALKPGSTELRFQKPETKRPSKAERKVAAGKARRAARRKRARRAPAVRVVAPPAQPPEAVADTPVADAPPPAPAAAPAPARPPRSGAGGGSAKPKPPGPTLWAGEG